MCPRALEKSCGTVQLLGEMLSVGASMKLLLKLEKSNPENQVERRKRFLVIVLVNEQHARAGFALDAVMLR